MRRALVLALLVLGLGAGVAHAGFYEVRSCANADRDPAWSLANMAPSTLVATARCPAPVGMPFDGLFAGAAIGTGHTAGGATASWTVSAPAATYLRRLTVQRYLGHRRNWAATVTTDGGTVLESCDVPWNQLDCEIGAPYGSGPQSLVTYDNLQSRAVTFGVRCDSVDNCTNGGSLHHAWMAIYAMTARIEDPAPPVIGLLAGSLSDQRWHDGNDTVTVTATDASGVKRIGLFVGSTEIGRRDGVCDYTRMRPCPGAMDAAITVNAAAVPDGTYTLRAVASDAADQDREAVAKWKIDRRPPAPPIGLTTSRADDGTYVATWVNPDQGSAAPIVAAHYAVCDSDQRNCGDEAVVRATRIDRIAGIRLPASDGQYVVRVWLEDEAGHSEAANLAVANVGAGGAIVIPRVVDTLPPVLLPAGPAPSPRLRVTRARREGSELVLSGTIARQASARVVAALARVRGGKAVVTARATPRRGKWTVRAKLPAAVQNAKALYLTLSFAGQGDSFRKTTLHRRLTRKPARGGSAAVEFSLETR